MTLDPYAPHVLDGMGETAADHTDGFIFAAQFSSRV
jgi:hypothetical protein